MKSISASRPTDRKQKATLDRLSMPKVMIVLVLMSCYAAGAGDPQAFEIPWFSIDGGGSTSAGNQYSVTGTIGQADAGAMTGGGFELSGGFWPASTTVLLPGDCERDGDVDLEDYMCFFACVYGPDQELLPDCEPHDRDDDGDVDMVDFSAFEIGFIGPR